MRFPGFNIKQEEIQMKRKILALLLVFCLAAGLLSGCGQTAQEPSEPPLSLIHI